jgi:hypothetical protein
MTIQPSTNLKTLIHDLRITLTLTVQLSLRTHSLGPRRGLTPQPKTRLFTVKMATTFLKPCRKAEIQSPKT